MAFDEAVPAVAVDEALTGDIPMQNKTRVTA
jgi:hypothetical protein